MLYTSSNTGSHHHKPPPPPPSELRTNCSDLVRDSDEYSSMTGFVMGMIFCAVFGVVILAFAIERPLFRKEDDLFHDFWLDLWTGKPFLLFLGLACLGGVAGLGYCTHTNAEESLARRRANIPTSAKDRPRCITFLQYQYEDGPLTYLEDVLNVTLPAGKVIRRIQTTDKQEFLRLKVVSKRTGATLMRRITQSAILIGHQLDYDAIFSTDEYEVTLMFDNPCNVSFMAIDIPPRYVDYIKNHRVIARECTNQLLYVTADEGGLTQVKVYCEV